MWATTSVLGFAGREEAVDLGEAPNGPAAPKFDLLRSYEHLRKKRQADEAASPAASVYSSMSGPAFHAYPTASSPATGARPETTNSDVRGSVTQLDSIPTPMSRIDGAGGSHLGPAVSPLQPWAAATNPASPGRHTPATARAAASAHAKVNLRANLNRDPFKLAAQPQVQQQKEQPVLQAAQLQVQPQAAAAKQPVSLKKGGAAATAGPSTSSSRQAGKEQVRSGVRKASDAQAGSIKPAGTKQGFESLRSTQGHSSTHKAARGKPAGPQLEVTGHSVAPPAMTGPITLRSSALLGNSSRTAGHAGAHHHSSASVQAPGAVVGAVPAADHEDDIPYTLHSVHAQHPQVVATAAHAHQPGMHPGAASPGNRGASLARLKELRGGPGRKQQHSLAPGAGPGPSSRSVASEASELISLLEHAEGLGTGAGSPRATQRTHLAAESSGEVPSSSHYTSSDEHQPQGRDVWRRPYTPDSATASTVATNSTRPAGLWHNATSSMQDTMSPASSITTQQGGALPSMSTHAESGFQAAGTPQQARTHAWAATQQGSTGPQPVATIGPHTDVATLAAAVAAVAATRSPARHPGPVVVMHTGTGNAPVLVYPAAGAPPYHSLSPQRQRPDLHTTSSAAQTEQVPVQTAPAGQSSPPPKWVHPSNVGVTAAGDTEGTAGRRGQIAEAIRRFREEPPRPKDSRAGSIPSGAASGQASAGQRGSAPAANTSLSSALVDTEGAAVDAVATALLARSRALLREKDVIQQRIQAALQNFKPDAGAASGSTPGAAGGPSALSPHAGSPAGAAGSSTSPAIPGSDDTMSWRQRLKTLLQEMNRDAGLAMPAVQVPSASGAPAATAAPPQLAPDPAQFLPRTWAAAVGSAADPQRAAMQSALSDWMTTLHDSLRTPASATPPVGAGASTRVAGAALGIPHPITALTSGSTAAAAAVPAPAAALVTAPIAAPALADFTSAAAAPSSVPVPAKSTASPISEALSSLTRGKGVGTTGATADKGPAAHLSSALASNLFGDNPGLDAILKRLAAKFGIPDAPSLETVLNKPRTPQESPREAAVQSAVEAAQGTSASAVSATSNQPLGTVQVSAVTHSPRGNAVSPTTQPPSVASPGARSPEAGSQLLRERSWLAPPMSDGSGSAASSPATPAFKAGRAAGATVQGTTTATQAPVTVALTADSRIPHDAAEAAGAPSPAGAAADAQAAAVAAAKPRPRRKWGEPGSEGAEEQSPPSQVLAFSSPAARATPESPRASSNSATPARDLSPPVRLSAVGSPSPSPTQLNGTPGSVEGLPKPKAFAYLKNLELQLSGSPHDSVDSSTSGPPPRSPSTSIASPSPRSSGLSLFAPVLHQLMGAAVGGVLFGGDTPAGSIAGSAPGSVVQSLAPSRRESKAGSEEGEGPVASSATAAAAGAASSWPPTAVAEVPPDQSPPGPNSSSTSAAPTLTPAPAASGGAQGMLAMMGQEALVGVHEALPRLRTNVGHHSALSATEAAAFMASSAASDAPLPTPGSGSAAAVLSTPSPLISRIAAHLAGGVTASPRGSTDSDASMLTHGVRLNSVVDQAVTALLFADSPHSSYDAASLANARARGDGAGSSVQHTPSGLGARRGTREEFLEEEGEELGLGSEEEDPIHEEAGAGGPSHPTATAAGAARAAVSGTGRAAGSGSRRGSEDNVLLGSGSGAGSVVGDWEGQSRSSSEDQEGTSAAAAEKGEAQPLHSQQLLVEHDGASSSDGEIEGGTVPSACIAAASAAGGSSSSAHTPSLSDILGGDEAGAGGDAAGDGVDGGVPLMFVLEDMLGGGAGLGGVPLGATHGTGAGVPPLFAMPFDLPLGGGVRRPRAPQCVIEVLESTSDEEAPSGPDAHTVSGKEQAAGAAVAHGGYRSDNASDVPQHVAARTAEDEHGSASASGVGDGAPDGPVAADRLSGATAHAGTAVPTTCTDAAPVPSVPGRHGTQSTAAHSSNHFAPEVSPDPAAGELAPHIHLDEEYSLQSMAHGAREPAARVTGTRRQRDIDGGEGGSSASSGDVDLSKSLRSSLNLLQDRSTPALTVDEAPGTLSGSTSSSGDAPASGAAAASIDVHTSLADAVAALQAYVNKGSTSGSVGGSGEGGHSNDRMAADGRSGHNTAAEGAGQQPVLQARVVELAQEVVALSQRTPSKRHKAQPQATADLMAAAAEQLEALTSSVHTVDAAARLAVHGGVHAVASSTGRSSAAGEDTGLLPPAGPSGTISTSGTHHTTPEPHPLSETAMFTEGLSRSATGTPGGPMAKRTPRRALFNADGAASAPASAAHSPSKEPAHIHELRQHRLAAQAARHAPTQPAAQPQISQPALPQQPAAHVVVVAPVLQEAGGAGSPAPGLLQAWAQAAAKAVAGETGDDTGPQQQGSSTHGAGDAASVGSGKAAAQLQSTAPGLFDGLGRTVSSDSKHASAPAQGVAPLQSTGSAAGITMLGHIYSTAAAAAVTASAPTGKHSGTAASAATRQPQPVKRGVAAISGGVSSGPAASGLLPLGLDVAAAAQGGVEGGVGCVGLSRLLSAEDVMIEVAELSALIPSFALDPSASPTPRHLGILEGDPTVATDSSGWRSEAGAAGAAAAQRARGSRVLSRSESAPAALRSGLLSAEDLLVEVNMPAPGISVIAALGDEGAPSVVVSMDALDVADAAAERSSAAAADSSAAAATVAQRQAVLTAGAAPAAVVPVSTPVAGPAERMASPFAHALGTAATSTGAPAAALPAVPRLNSVFGAQAARAVTRTTSAATSVPAPGPRAVPPATASATAALVAATVMPAGLPAAVAGIMGDEEDDVLVRLLKSKIAGCMNQLRDLQNSLQ